MRERETEIKKKRRESNLERGEDKSTKDTKCRNMVERGREEKRRA